jgi:hypothetical protein
VTAAEEAFVRAGPGARVAERNMCSVMRSREEREMVRV